MLGDRFRYRIWLVALFLGWAALVCLPLAVAEPHGAHSARIPVWARMLSSFSLVAAGWLWFLTSSGWAARRLALGIAVGMSLGALGDVALAELVVSGRTAILAGMVLFGAGHVAYLFGMLDFRRWAGGFPSRLSGPWTAFTAIAVVAWVAVVFRAEASAALVWGALAYSCLLAAMAGVARGIAVEHPSLWLLGIGGPLFFASDLVLSVELFQPALFARLPDAIRGDLVWMLYGPAQACLVFASVVASRTEPQLAGAPTVFPAPPRVVPSH